MGSRVEVFAAIRWDARLEGLSVRALAARHEVHRRTVLEALASAVPPAQKVSKRPAVPYRCGGSLDVCREPVADRADAAGNLDPFGLRAICITMTHRHRHDSKHCLRTHHRPASMSITVTTSRTTSNTTGTGALQGRPRLRIVCLS